MSDLRNWKWRSPFSSEVKYFVLYIGLLSLQVVYTDGNAFGGVSLFWWRWCLSEISAWLFARELFDTSNTSTLIPFRPLCPSLPVYWMIPPNCLKSQINFTENKTFMISPAHVLKLSIWIYSYPKETQIMWERNDERYYQCLVTNQNCEF